MMACIEPFEIEPTKTETTLVIEAKFTDEAKSHQVTVSEAHSLTSISLDQYALDTTLTSPVSKATIWLEDETGPQTLSYLQMANLTEAILAFSNDDS